MVNDDPGLPRVETGQIELLPQPTSAAALLRDTVAIMAPEARAKGLSMNLEIIDPVDALHDLDADRLRQVLINLLNNAVKFTEEGRSRRAADRRARRGRGPPALRDHRHRRWHRPGQAGPAGSSASRRPTSSVSRLHGGAGPGLAICRALVEVMGGKIGVDSVPGRGSCFWVELTAPTAEPIIVPERPKVSSPGAAKVLIVDDHPVNLEIGEALLTLVGCEVDVAENGKQAVEKATGGRYDVILMDIHMPRMDGLQATRARSRRCGARPDRSRSSP
ncbi:response regulator [Caulobacter segnis]